MEKIYGGTIAAQNHSAPLPGSIPGVREEDELERDGGEAALTDSVADRLRRLVTGEDSKSAFLGRRFGTDARMVAQGSALCRVGKKLAKVCDHKKGCEDC